MTRRSAGLAALLLALAGVLPAWAGQAGFCDRHAQVDAVAQDRLLRLGAVIKAELDRSGRRVALIARSGLDLGRFGIRYSHAGISLKASPSSPWSVRQLYYACDESRPRLFDQGVPGFLLGTDDPSSGYISLVLLPGPEEAELERAALDRSRALGLLSGAYSANAHVYSTRYQNCNQWVMEMIAAAWGLAGIERPTREQAQQWLRARGHWPQPVDVGSHALMFAMQFVPLLHVDDHPLADLQALKVRTTLPSAIEAFVRAQAPQAERIELCHDERHIVVRRGWEPLGPGCRATLPHDEVIPFGT